MTNSRYVKRTHLISFHPPAVEAATAHMSQSARLKFGLAKYLHDILG